MINLVTGLPGSGKTLWTLSTVHKYVEAENKLMAEQGKPPRQVYYHGIPQLTLDWTLMESPEEWINLPNGSIIIVDECQSTFRPRATGAAVPKYVSEFETHRHKGLDFFLLTQHPMLVDQNIRRLAGKHYHVIRFFGFQKSTIHEFQSVKQDVDRSQKNSIKNHFVFPKEVFTWYKSADLHTMKKRIPLRLIAIVVLPLLLIAALYFFWDTASRLGKPKDTSKTDNPPASQSTHYNQQSKPTVTPPSELTYIQAYKPEIEDIQASAPIYREIAKPTTFPKPAACIIFKGQCSCYTQQATKYQTSDTFCRNIVKNGYFDDTLQSEKSQQMSEPSVQPVS